MRYRQLTVFLLCVLLLGAAAAACGRKGRASQSDASQSDPAGAGGSEDRAPQSDPLGGAEGTQTSGTAEGGEHSADPHQEGPAINVWGDSMAQGVYGDGVAYPDVLGQLTGITTHNFGITSEDSVEIMNRSLAYGDQSDDVMIIQMGDNGGWKDIEELLTQHQKMIESGGTDRYIVVTSTDDPDDLVQIWGRRMARVGLRDTWYEAAYKEHFGDHVFIARKYLIEHGLEVNGLEETEEDRRRAGKGNISLQLRNPEIDNTHLSAAGYRAMAYGLYEKGKELGYWK